MDCREVIGQINNAEALLRVARERLCSGDSNGCDAALALVKACVRVAQVEALNFNAKGATR
jgi:hypothetical protein